MVLDQDYGQSRVAYPKPFIEVAGKPLLAHALERASLISGEAIIVTNQDHYFLTEKLLKKTPKAPQVSYLLEPKGRNTAPAIALAVRHIQKPMAIRLCVWFWRLIISFLMMQRLKKPSVKR